MKNLRRKVADSKSKPKKAPQLQPPMLSQSPPCLPPSSLHSPSPSPSLSMSPPPLLEFKNRNEGAVLEIGGSNQFVRKLEIPFMDGYKPPPPLPSPPSSTPHLGFKIGATKNTQSWVTKSKK
uniref:Uncharacterized protein n=1 Tax=Lactuca sativa TaxID=4236 RepID=A0A9R1UC87_LACSA|nr:hypothetical protein LSAT_V11C900472940 [Lactuca sativa]